MAKGDDASEAGTVLAAFPDARLLAAIGRDEVIVDNRKVLELRTNLEYTVAGCFNLCNVFSSFLLVSSCFILQQLLLCLP